MLVLILVSYQHGLYRPVVATRSVRIQELTTLFQDGLFSSTTVGLGPGANRVRRGVISTLRGRSASEHGGQWIPREQSVYPYLGQISPSIQRSANVAAVTTTI